MKKKVIIHSMNMKNMESMLDYYYNNNLANEIKLIIIESNNANNFFRKLRKLYYIYIGNYDAIVSDYPTRLLEKSKLISISMGHGTAIKKFPSDEELKDKKILRLCMTYKAADYYITTSERQNKLEFRNKAFEHYTKNEYLSLGLPKNDYYFNTEKTNRVNLETRKKLGFSTSDYIILYAPTWRNYKVSINLFNVEYLKSLNEMLTLHNGYFIYRPHTSGGTINEKLIEDLNLERIINSRELNIDVFQSLCISNALITDYSSIAIEYLPLNKPILFFLFDYEEYEKYRGIEFDYQDESISPGFVVKNEKELLNSIIDIINNNFNNFYWGNRRKTCLLNHYKYPDGNSSERIWKLILSKINNI